MKKYALVAVMAAMLLPADAQTTIGQVLADIESNNTTLKALRAEAEAQKLDNRTGMTLADPEVEFAYLWGSPAVMGNRKDFSASQQFDFATLSGKKRALASQRDVLIDLQLKAERLAIITEARMLCVDMVYYNALAAEMQTRLDAARAVADAQKKRLDSGDGNQIEYNNVLMSLAAAEAEMARVSAERQAVATNLSRLNGGHEVSLQQQSFDVRPLPSSFEQWYAVAEAGNPTLAYVRQEVEVSNRQLSLDKAQNVPSLTLGYMSENTREQTFRGVTVGVSVPLWSNRNKIRQAHAAREAAELRLADARQTFYSQVRMAYDKAVSLRDAAVACREASMRYADSRLLRKAYDEGHLAVVDYLVQMGFCYDAANRALNAEREYQRALCELRSFSADLTSD